MEIPVRVNYRRYKATKTVHRDRVYQNVQFIQLGKDLDTKQNLVAESSQEVIVFT